MLKSKITILVLLFSCLTIQAQETNKTFEIRFHGFVRADAAIDSRVNTESREGFFIFYPAPKLIDKNGRDLNARANFNQYAMISRLKGELNGPELLKAKTYALIEGDFTGPSNMENNAFRLRHAYIRFDWTKSRLFTGQYWTPMDAPEALPRMLALNTGAPFHSFARSPQIRFEQYAGNFSFIGVAYSQRDYPSPGPDPTLKTPAIVSPDFVRYAIIPNLHVQIQYKWNNNLLIAGANYKKLAPRLKTDSLLFTNETIQSAAVMVLAKIETKIVSIRTQAVYGQNLSDHLLLGGYAVESEDTLTNIRKYINLNTLALWTDIMTNTKTWQAGLFAGYTQNLGTNRVASNRFYGRGDAIDYVYRLSPRLQYNAMPLQFLAEIEYTTVAYGQHDQNYKTITSEPVSNFRFQLAAVYNF